MATAVQLEATPTDDALELPELLMATELIGTARSATVVFLADGQVLTSYTMAGIAEALGAPVQPRRGSYDLVVVGAGPAGLSAAVYGASGGLSTLVVEGTAMGRAGRHQLADPQLPRLSHGRQRRRAGRAGLDVRRRVRVHQRRHRPGARPGWRPRRAARSPRR